MATIYAAIEVANMDGLWKDSEKETFNGMVNMPNKDPFFAMVVSTSRYPSPLPTPLHMRELEDADG